MLKYSLKNNKFKSKVQMHLALKFIFYVIYIFPFSTINNCYSQNLQLSIGSNFQNHKTKFVQNELNTIEVNKNIAISPILGLNYSINNKNQLIFSIFYYRFNKQFETNINFNNPIYFYDEISTTHYERMPAFNMKYNKLIINKSKYSFGLGIGVIVNGSLNNFQVNSNFSTVDNQVNGTYKSFSKEYFKLNPNLSIVASYKLTNKIKLNFQFENCFGSNNFFFTEEWNMTDNSGVKKTSLYGLNGRMYNIEVSLGFKVWSK